MKTVPPVKEMPSLAHLSTKDYQNVYEPSDDTFLLCDALSADVDELRRNCPALCVEVGSGSGCVTAHLASLLPAAAVLAIDVNSDATIASRATARANNVAHRVAALQMDLLAALRPASIDVLVFNPPYVPTSEEELAEALETRDISASWAGGTRGRRVLDKLLPHVGTALSPCGAFYLLGVAENDVDEVRAQRRGGAEAQRRTDAASGYSRVPLVSAARAHRASGYSTLDCADWCLAA